MTRRTDEELVRLAGDGDHESFTLLVERHERIALFVAERIVRDPSRAEEVRQDAFLSAWLTCGRFDPARGAVRAWLLGIVRHRALDVVASRRFTPASAYELLEWEHEAGAYDATEAEVIRWDDASRLRRLIEALPAEQAQAIELVFLGQLSRAEAAARIGVPPSTVKGRVHTGLEQLRRRLDPLALGRP